MVDRRLNARRSDVNIVRGLKTHLGHEQGGAGDQRAECGADAPKRRLSGTPVVLLAVAGLPRVAAPR